MNSILLLDNCGMIFERKNVKLVERLLEEHEHRIEAHMNEKWMKDISELEAKLKYIE